MYRITILSDDPERFSSFAKGIEDYKIPSDLRWETSLKKAIDSLEKDTPHLVVVDENIGGIPGIEAARQIVVKNAMVQLAVVSGLSEDKFHETFEGLGILARVGNPPDSAEADNLVRRLESFSAIQS